MKTSKRSGEIKMVQPNQWLIQDSHGVIHSGSEDEMKALWDDPDEIYKETVIFGDLQLVEVHAVMK